jgi:HSP20 family protein
MADKTLERKDRSDLTQANELADRGITHTPRVDILEDDDKLTLVIDLPGVQAKDLDIRFENNELTLSGRRASRSAGKPWLVEFEPGSFYRAFRVTEHIAGDKIAADLKNGVLTLHLPKVEAVKPRRIAVKCE